MIDDSVQDQPRITGLPRPSLEGKARFSGESLTPRDGYSGLFTSGMFPQCEPTPSTTLSSFPSPPKSPPENSKAQSKDRYPQSLQKGKPLSVSPNKRSHLAPPIAGPSAYSPATPARRRRSSIIYATSESTSPRIVKSVGNDNGVERALDSVMRNLRVAVTPKKYSYYGPQSRWSSSTEGSLITIPLDTEEDAGGSGGLFKPRKSSDTTRSKMTVRSTRSTKSKGRKSEDTDRIDLVSQMDDIIPGVPPVPAVPTRSQQAPTTPGRSRRMMNGLARRLGLTPKKGSKGPTSAMPIPPYPAPPPPPLPSPLPLPPPPGERTISKKSSLSTIRSALTKKSSSTTLRSVRSNHQSVALNTTHPFMSSASLTMDCGTPPPLPGLPRPRERSDVEGCFPIPTTPKTNSGRRTPKSSIGQPKPQPDISPSHFLKEIPRRAPETPKRRSFDLPNFNPDENMQTPKMDGVIRFEEEDLGDIVMSPNGKGDMDNPPELEADESMDESHEIFTPPPSVTAPQCFEAFTQALGSPFPPHQASTPTLQAKGAQVHRDRHENAARPKRMVTLIPSRTAVGTNPGSPVLGMNTPPSLKLRTKKSAEGLLKGAPLSSKSVNALGLPAAPAESRPVSRASRKDPLGIMKRFGRSSKPAHDPENDMPFRSGAGDGWDTPMPMPMPTPKPYHHSGEALPRKALDLGTVESYFDPALNTFGAPRNPLMYTTRALPDFSAPPPPPSVNSSFVPSRPTAFERGDNGTESSHFGFQTCRSAGSTSDSMEIAMERPRSFADDEPHQSPEYHFQLDPTDLRAYARRNIDFDMDMDMDMEVEQGRSGNAAGYASSWRAKKVSQSSEVTSVSMTTGEGVEEWELERYLRDLEAEEIRREG
ncbi:hypothetical protein I316_06321 [Kwoniella heveanensis BCC8398]|uniref:Uncharacterized protein n=1 Tax=Kwoniella heveanensis BCC8398 TaxID=1296120 RepID=A0A1B9GLI2_9TREE|nr:hypothetical protein I316_06321 [Kwoniella heveanensis BCC8398]